MKGIEVKFTKLLSLMDDELILVLNSGSSSIKFSVFNSSEFLSRGKPLDRFLRGEIERIGGDNPSFSCTEDRSHEFHAFPLNVSTHSDAADFLIQWIGQKFSFSSFSGVGHRVVHGGDKYAAPALVTAELLEDLRKFSAFDPDHLPAEIAVMTKIQTNFPDAAQVACFDTAFHHDLPPVAKILPIPRHYQRRGVRRYGFHGISYAYLLEELKRLGGEKEAESRVVFAHLGSGASLAAVHHGECLDTSMSFTPVSGVPMSTRSGDLDPGLFWYFIKTEGMTPLEFNQMVNTQSGLLGISETSSDIKELLEFEKKDPRAEEAVAYFCFQVKKWIGSFAAVLGGIDTLVFSGGIGENAAVIRERICSHLEFLGIQLDPEFNRRNAPIISDQGSRARVRVIKTDEEVMIAKDVCKVLRKLKSLKRRKGGST